MKPMPWPQPRFWIILAVVVALSTSLTTIGAFSWGPPQWTRLTAGTREGILLPAIAASIGAALVGQTFCRGSVVAGRTSGAVAAAVSRQTAILTLSVIIGYLVGLAPALVALVMKADGGRPDILSLASSAAAVVALTLVSFLVATVTPYGWGLILGPATSTLVALIPALANPLLGHLEKSTRQSSAVWFNQFPLPGWHITPQTSMYRIILFTYLAICCVIITKSIVTASVPDNRFRLLGALSILGAMTLTSTAVSPHLMQRDDAKLVCSTVQNVEVCVLPEYASVSNAILGETSFSLGVVGQDSAGLRVVQSIGANQEFEDGTLSLTFNGISSSEELSQRLKSELALVLSGGTACHTRFAEQRFENLSNEDQSSLDAQMGLSLTLQRRLGLSSAHVQVDESSGKPIMSSSQEKLESLDETEFRNWYVEHVREISSCTLLEDDLP